jgi:hypothetical protein
VKQGRLRGGLPWLILIGFFLGAMGYVLTALPEDREAVSRRPPAAPAAMPAAPDDGLSDSHDGYTLRPVTVPTGRGAAVPLAFRVHGPDGRPAVGYAPLQERPLHLYVVREDLQFYQHLHPELAGDTWTANVRVPDGGVYRAYAEFVPEPRSELASPAGPAGLARPARAVGHPTVLGTRFIIAGDTRTVPVPAPAAHASTGGFGVRRLDGTAPVAADRPAALRFQVLDRGGRPVPDLEPYLGAYAHVSAFDVYTQALTHLHPVASASASGPPADGTLTFHARFANRGEQRLFLQFRAGGAVRQAAFTVAVT